MEHSRFVHLHLHTQYSLLDGAIRPAELLELSKEYKMPAVAMTDHGNIFGAVDFYQKAMKSGVKPIIGCEVYVAPGSMTDKTPPLRKGQGRAFHLVLLVKNITGYHNLCKLLSRAYIDGFYYKPRVDKELLKECNEGLIALSACLQGEVANNLLNGQTDTAIEAARSYLKIFPDRRFFLELQDNGLKEQQKVKPLIIDLARKLEIPLVATNDCHYLRKSDSKAHDILLCIQTGKTVNSPERMKFTTNEFYFKSPEEMIERFKDIPEAIENTIEIAERCNLELTLGENYLPEFPLPEGKTVDTFLTEKTERGLQQRLCAIGLLTEDDDDICTDVAKNAPAKNGPDKDDEPTKWVYYERLQKELKVIKKMGFSGYFLIVCDFIEHAREKNIPVGPGRGSAAGSLVAYALGITNIDPIKFNLLFERFLNPDRISLPDIDIDFCFEGRDEVIRYTTEKYGQDNVTQIITFGQMKAKAVIRDVGRALDIPYGEVDRIAKLVPATIGITIADALKEEPKLKKLSNDDERISELLSIAMELEGIPRHASTHAAGVVISQKPLVDYLPLYKGQKDDVVTTQFPMNDVEKIGLVKFDFLGIKTLTLIDKAVKLVKLNHGTDIDIEKIPLDDKATYELVTAANTNGVFQLESSGIKDLLKKLKPSTFEDMMAAVALYRPGPLQSGMVDDYIKRKHKQVPITYELPELKPILENTYGVMVYQEQVMEISKVLAGFTPGDADVLRKAMGKKVHEVMLEQRSFFLEGAKKKKIPQKKAEKIFDLMAHFAGYGFNKSHSAAYAMIAYETAYLKAHYPVEFMAALLTINKGDTDKVIKYIAECRDTGIDILPPDINESDRDFTVTGEAIRFGLGAIKNVGTAAIEEILKAREANDGEEDSTEKIETGKDGTFTGLINFLERVDSRRVNKKVLESLIKCGALDFTGKTRAALMSALDASLEIAQSLQRDREIGQTSLFDVLGGGGGSVGGNGDGTSRAGANVSANKEKEVPEWDEKDLLTFEKETLGFYITSHPLVHCKDDLMLYSKDTTASVKEKRTGTETAIGGMATHIRETITKKGAKMAFINFEDLEGGIEIVMFSDLYDRARDFLDTETPLLVVGKLERGDSGGRGGRGGGGNADSEECKLIATDVMPLSEARVKYPKKTHIFTKTETVKEDTFAELKKILELHPGNSEVILHLIYPDKKDIVVGLPENLMIEPGEQTFSEITSVMQGSEIRTT